MLIRQPFSCIVLAALAAAGCASGSRPGSGLTSPLSGLTGKPAAPTASALGQPARPGTDNALVAGWKKTTAALAAPFKSSAPNEDPTSLASKTGKVNADVYVSAARLYEHRGDFASAVKQYQRALQVEPNNLTALISVARVHDRLGETREAVAAYQRAIAIDPKSALAHNDLGLCFARQKDVPNSLRHLQQAVELKPDSPLYRNNLATLLVEAGRPEDAFRQLAAGNPPAVAHYNLAVLLQQAGQESLAQQHAQQALAADPRMSPARELLAQLGGPPAEPFAQGPPALPPAAQEQIASPSDAGWREVHVAQAPAAASAPVAEAPPYQPGSLKGTSGAVQQLPVTAPRGLPPSSQRSLYTPSPFSLGLRMSLGGDDDPAPRPQPTSAAVASLNDDQEETSSYLQQASAEEPALLPVEGAGPLDPAPQPEEPSGEE